MLVSFAEYYIPHSTKKYSNDSNVFSDSHRKRLIQGWCNLDQDINDTAIDQRCKRLPACLHAVTLAQVFRTLLQTCI